MKSYTLHRTTRLDTSINEAWSFFVNPNNLSKITPSSMKFTVLTKDLPSKIYSGLLIDYTVVPLLGIPMHWTTEITDVDHPYFFADEQKAGPYKYWRHEHRFKKEGDSTIMHDTVTYVLPLGVLGQLAHSITVKKKITDIFDYRTKVIQEIFPGSIAIT